MGAVMLSWVCGFYGCDALNSFHVCEVSWVLCFHHGCEVFIGDAFMGVRFKW